MSYEDARQLVRIRHELRRLSPDRDQFAATRLLARMRAVAARDAVEHAAIQPELLRWQVAFRLDGAAAGP